MSKMKADLRRQPRATSQPSWERKPRKENMAGLALLTLCMEKAQEQSMASGTQESWAGVIESRARCLSHTADLHSFHGITEGSPSATRK